MASLTVSVAVLTSCASTDGFSDLDRERQANDSPPETLDFADDDEILLDSSRSVGTYEGAELWLARTSDDGVCLIAYTDEMDWVVGCSDIPPLGVSGSPGSFIVVSDGQDPPENATRISDNVFGL
ncbi:hypothetical protein [Ornithinimicrobium pratense]|uniref:Uncharacterized protein n=1 Tax=Ornithinimicrobium pratense TaxID=2593973 RepID=A0A5J6V5V3_9MICO|nr:hypothetical protein [Ornithinimicrobium pratense]QFG68403.1 hypothetical protein FY030_06460 [Ornithinimicrobium pratense]